MTTKNYTFSVTGDKFQLSIVTLQLLSLYPTIQRLYEIIVALMLKKSNTVIKEEMVNQTKNWTRLRLLQPGVHLGFSQGGEIFKCFRKFDDLFLS